MSLPATIRVKLSSEAAEGISITRVVVQEMPLRDLIGHMLGITGKDHARVRELLLRGTLVSGASRFRWAGWEADAEDIRQLLAAFPDSEPGRTFDAIRCSRAVLRGGRQIIEIPREAASHRPLLRKSSFWGILMEVASAGGQQYLHYSYKDNADAFRRELSLGDVDKIRAAGEIVRYTTLRDQIRAGGYSWLELFVQR